MAEARRWLAAAAALALLCIMAADAAHTGGVPAPQDDGERKRKRGRGRERKKGRKEGKNNNGGVFCFHLLVKTGIKQKIMAEKVTY